MLNYLIGLMCGVVAGLFFAEQVLRWSNKREPAALKLVTDNEPTRFLVEEWAEVLVSVE